FHQAGVKGIESLQLLGNVVPFAVGLGDHHHRRVRQRATAEHEQLEYVVERRRVRVARTHDGQDLGQVFAEELAAQLALAGTHPVDVSHQRVDLAVVADYGVGVGQLPGGQG